MLKAAVKGLAATPGLMVPHVYGMIDDGAERDGHGYVVFKDRVLFIGGWAYRGGICRAKIEDQGTEHGVQNDCWDVEHLVPFGQADTDVYRIYHRLKENCDFPARSHMAMCVVGGHTLYMCGGRTDPVRHEFLNDLWKTSDGVNWEPVLHEAPWRPRHSHAIVPCQDGSDDILMMGGRAGKIVDGWQSFNDVWRFVAAEAKWVQVVEHAGWTPRATPTVKNGRDGEIVLIGGEAILPVESPAEGLFGPDDKFADVWVTRDCGRTWECAAEAPPFPPTAEAWFDYIRTNDLYVLFGKRSGPTGQESRVWHSRDLREWTVSSELVVDDMIDEVALNHEIVHCLKRGDGFVFLCQVLQ